jgi:hypothetical protein
MRPGDDQVFLLLGTTTENNAVVSVVLARDVETAKTAFQKANRGAIPLSWPSLLNLKESVTMMELARAGKILDKVDVINAFSDQARLPEALCANSVDCPNTVIEGLDALRGLIIELGHEDPFGNTDGSLKTESFFARAYVWDYDLPGEFQWQDVRVTWYKYLGRDTKISRRMGSSEVRRMITECKDSLTDSCRPSR